MSEQEQHGTENYALNGADDYAVGCAVNAVYALCQSKDIPCLCVVQTSNCSALDAPCAMYHNGVWVNEQREDPIMHLLQYLHSELQEPTVITWEFVDQLKADIRKRLDELEE